MEQLDLKIVAYKFNEYQSLEVNVGYLSGLLLH